MPTLYLRRALQRMVSWLVALGMLLCLLGGGGVSAIAAEVGSSPERAGMSAGVAAFRQGDYPAAIAAFGEAIRANPNSAAAYGNRCLARIYQREYAEAIADCTQALRLDPRNTEAYLNRWRGNASWGMHRACIRKSGTAGEKCRAGDRKMLQLNP